MPEHTNPQERLDRVEHVHHALLDTDDPLLRFVPLAAAVLAIFAGLGGLYSSRLGEESLIARSQAVLSQAQASDFWSEYQAESVKAHVYEAALAAAPATARTALNAKIRKYRALQPGLKRDALAKEEERTKEFERSERAENRHLVFDVAVAQFEIAIVLTSIAAMTRRQWLFVVSALLAAGGVVAAAYGATV